MIDHFFVAVLADLPTKPVLAIAGKWRLVSRALCVTRVGIANKIRREYLFPAKLAAIHVDVKPPAQVGNAHEDSACRLHVVVGLFELTADHLAGIRRIGVDDIRGRYLKLLCTRL